MAIIIDFEGYKATREIADCARSGNLRLMSRQAAAKALTMSSSKRPYIGVNIYLKPEDDLKQAQLKRYVFHGILSVRAGRKATFGLTTAKFSEGGVLKIRCNGKLIQSIRGDIAKLLPGICVKRVRRTH